MKSGDYNAQSYALDLFKALVEKEQGYQEAITAAQKGMKSEHDYVRFVAHELIWKIEKKTA